MKRDFFLDKKREKAKLEAEMKLQVTLKVLVPSAEAEPTGTLNVMCGQFFINTASFCKEINSFNVLWENGVIVPLVVTKGLRAKEYNVVFKPPTTTYLIDSITRYYLVHYLDLWALVKIKERIHTITDTAAARLIFSDLHRGILFLDENLKLFNFEGVEDEEDDDFDNNEDNEDDEEIEEESSDEEDEITTT